MPNAILDEAQAGIKIDKNVNDLYAEYIHLYIYRYIYILTVEYYSVMRKKEILPFVTTWMNLSSIMLSVRQVSKTKTNTI